jgi:hypothetical protein
MSNEKKEKVFADGFMFKMKPDSPEWVIGSISLKSEDAIKFINEHTDKGWLNLNVHVGKSGKPYVELDQWKPTQKTDSPSQDTLYSSDKEDLPF